MRLVQSERGLWYLEHPRYALPCDVKRLASESSGATKRCLWVGEHHHLDEQQVAYLIGALQRWLHGGRLGTEEEAARLKVAERLEKDPDFLLKVAKRMDDDFADFKPEE